MATKKKAAKPAKKTTPVKKAAPAKKPAAKAAHPPAAKAAHPAKAAKHAPKKVAKPAPTAAKKHTPAPAPPVKKGSAKPAVKPPAHKPAAAAKPAAHAQPIKKTEVNHTVMPKKEELKTKLINIPPPKKPAPPSKPAKVVIPEMKTKTVRKYEPEFTKSVLDQPEITHSGPTMRYSDAELQEFRELIQKKLDQAKKELTYLQGLITRKDEMGGDENENRYMTMEDGSMSMEREQLAQMASRQINYIDHLEKSMMRIENRTYGICRVTGKLIDKARLRAVPHATLSIEAKQMMNK
ncbi:MAG TPA: TraR/DksA C4-type zinc finger protein [Flavitalea sp.]|nr:TraR/DksA C4-type zinc finger protein [Flavitalea sp.]